VQMFCDNPKPIADKRHWRGSQWKQCNR